MSQRAPAQKNVASQKAHEIAQGVVDMVNHKNAALPIENTRRSSRTRKSTRSASSGSSSGSSGSSGSSSSVMSAGGALQNDPPIDEHEFGEYSVEDGLDKLKAANICSHGRRRYTCKICGGKGICSHGRQRYQCKECGGGGICPHKRIRSQCKGK